WKTIEISKAQIDRCRYMTLPRTGQGEATLEQHRQIIRALNSGDPELAGSAMRAHLDSAYRSAVAVLDAPVLAEADA
ncbi:MAG: FCD domain-containing protein, partial [Rhizobiaceae bacterium]